MRSHSNVDVARIVESEGLGYAITGYMSSDGFEDPDLAELWDAAHEILTEIQERLDAAQKELGEFDG